MKEHWKLNISGDYNGEDTPVPIPNTEVKLSSAEDTWLETARENRSLPEFYENPESKAQGFVFQPENEIMLQKEKRIKAVSLTP